MRSTGWYAPSSAPARARSSPATGRCPTTYNATKRLISGLLEAARASRWREALDDAQRGLMDDPETSHPFYWAAFIILGDGAKPLVSANPLQAIASR